MRLTVRRLGDRCVLAVLALVALSAAAEARAQDYRFELPDVRGMRWFKGNTHTHTLESDGDSPPECVARWYKEHGYNFLVLSDHDVLTDPARLAHLADSTFILIVGEEVSASFERVPVHVNALSIARVVEPREGSTLVETLQNNIDAVRAVGGVPHINHPNYRWAFRAKDLAAVSNYKLLEIYNGHPSVHNFGGGDSPSVEAVWDQLLTRGKLIYGIASDDAHHFQAEFGPRRVNPGRGWVVVRARRLEAEEIVRNLEDGLFYASTGVELTDVVVTTTRLAVHIKQRGDFKYTTTFIGSGGKVLKETGGNPAIFELDGPTDYVRARVRDSGGWFAWTQPVFVTQTSLPMSWKPIDSLNVNLPSGVRVYAGRNDALPLRAWYVRIDEPDPAIITRIVVSDDTTDNRETTSSFARDLGACVAVNGGYFTMNRTPAGHVGLLLADGVLWEPATRSVMRDTLRFEIARAAIGFTADDEIEFTWATTRDSTIYAWADPPPNRPGQPSEPLDYERGHAWQVRDAIGAGPALVMGGRMRVTSDEEVFFGTSIPRVHPRTAAGRTTDGALILMVVDGRQPESRGVSLEELATLMLEVGAVEAINLDGGGSSTLVVNGVLVNRPQGRTDEREVMSALVTYCQ